MAKDPKRLRKDYEFKIGKDLTDKLSDEQIGLLSKYYNSLSLDEQRDIDNKIFKGMTNDLFEMAYSFIEEKKASVATSVIDDEDDDDFEPLGLDELLGDIKTEAKKESALALYQGTRQDDLVDEEIDERILRLLGLEEVFDIDYGTYLTLLKEKMIAARMTQQQLSTEESELLTDEFKRIKGKVGRFTIKKKKINVADVGGGVGPIKVRKALKPAEIVKKPEEDISEEKSEKKADPIVKYLSEIVPIVTSIRNLLQEQVDLSNKIRDNETRRLENERRRSREDEAERRKGAARFLKNLKGAMPSLGIFDVIKRFLTNVILGRAIFKFLEWMGNPENKKKLNALGNFLKDWWPALLGAFVLFATPLGAFIRGTVGLIASFTKFILTKAIPKLIMFAAKNPLIAAGVIAGGATLGAYLWNKQEEDKQVKKESEKRGVSQDTVRREIEQEREGILGQIGEAFNNIGPLGFSEGGFVPDLSKIFAFSGGGFAPIGSDTIPAMLSPGEFIMSKGAVDKFGVGNLMAMNAAGGGNNKPKVRGGISYAAGGGPTKPNSQAIKDYGSKLKYKNPIQGYPNYEKPTDEFGKFFARIYNAAKAAGDPFPEVVAAQAVEESNFGKSPLAKEANNLFGQDAPPSYPASKKYDYIDPIEGKHTAIKFSSIEESVKYRVKTWKKFYGNAKTPSEAIRNIAKAGYNPHAVYPGKIEKVLKEYGIVPTLPRPINDVKPQTPPKPNKKIKPTGGSFLDMLPSPIRNLIPFGNRSQLSPNMEKRELQMILRNIQGGMLGDPNSPQNKRQIENIIQRIHNLPRVQIPEQPSVASASMITLPPITQNVGDGQQFPAMGSKDPEFPVISSKSIGVRNMVVDTYGIS